MELYGVLFRLMDYAYWLYVTDLGVDKDYEGRGIGRQLMETAHDKAGGEQDIAVYLIANENAVPFYEKIGMKKVDDVMQYNHIEWTEFTVFSKCVILIISLHLMMGKVIIYLEKMQMVHQDFFYSTVLIIP